MLGKYIFGCDAVCFVYDTTNAESFKNVEDWLQFVKQEFKDRPLPYCALIGNKIDLPQRQVRSDKHNLMAVENKLVPFLVSAKSGEKVNGMFTKIAADLAKVTLTKSEFEVQENTVTAAIVQHPAAPVPSNPAKPPNAEEKKDDCTIM